MKLLFFVIFFPMATIALGQSPKPEDFGFRHLYKGDTVDILIKSKKGSELRQLAAAFD